MERLYLAADLQEAHLLRHQLEAERIDVHIFNENAHGAVGELPFTHTYPELWLVNGDDLDRAQKIIAYYQRPTEIGGSRECERCGEANPGTFEICWRCGQEF